MALHLAWDVVTVLEPLYVPIIPPFKQHLFTGELYENAARIRPYFPEIMASGNC